MPPRLTRGGTFPGGPKDARTPSFESIGIELEITMKIPH